MKTKTITLILSLISLFAVKAQSFQYSPIAQVSTSGAYWLVSQSSLNQYLTAQLNQNGGIEGDISSSTILLENGVYYAVGHGQAGSSEYARNIKLALKVDVDGLLTFDFVNGGTETCTGAPCEECDFASGGGCTCKRTKESQSGTNGTCNHSVTKESPCTSGL